MSTCLSTRLASRSPPVTSSLRHVRRTGARSRSKRPGWSMLATSRQGEVAYCDGLQRTCARLGFRPDEGHTREVRRIPDKLLTWRSIVVQPRKELSSHSAEPASPLATFSTTRKIPLLAEAPYTWTSPKTEMS